ncbi:hypothetical protein F7731_23745 [Cytobacillus depressus]|uniref:BrnA antitoxin family protein n=1 Tax=Cytobacillus depressus TaxID=1602942 RepID=A0A6L3UZP5_9BACI|nr:hypothetical protein [Cytobacillus depressus]KAB2328966.1 hypothetical protein F7731_23745 [Cytobacillus depressus]
MSKAEEYKQKMLNQQQKRDRNARSELMGGEVQENTPQVQTEDDKFTLELDAFVLRMAHPEQTFGTRANRTELIGCHFEPKVAKLIKADQKRMGRGWQSHLLNELAKEYYKKTGKL